MRVVMPLYDGVDLLDVAGPAEMLRWTDPAADVGPVQLLAEQPGAVRTNGGIVLEVDAGLGDPVPCDALSVPGGNPVALERLIHDTDGPFLEFLRRQAPVSRYVCSVCEGALLLAAAGLLDGYTVTTHWAFVPYLLEHHRERITVADGHPRFVLDRDRLTGGGISAGLDEALKLIELLAGEDTAQRVQQVTQYYPEPPVRSAIPNTTTVPAPLT